ncbi:hypothetical protein F5884DRAFT_315906 [Xylogone sp. PMI_703]|nr:hypothetical protein F5884DRAFT_315906 [Xylogone sp. PMI_703]
MIRIMDTITDKPNWHIKVFDEEIVQRWTNEALGPIFTKAMMDWVLAELQYKVKLFNETGIVISYNNGGVVKSDTAVPEEIRGALKKAVRPLEDTPEKDYHPGSNEKVLDLVHPSLFPLVYGRTKFLTDGVIGLDNFLARVGHGEVLHKEDEESEPSPYSVKFQWLPCDVMLDAENGCKINSYINNLHPVKHKELYELIKIVIDCAIPLWEYTLWPVDKNNLGEGDQRICYPVAYYRERSPNRQAAPPGSNSGSSGEPQGSEASGDEDSEGSIDEEDEHDPRYLIQPEPDEFSPIANFRVNLLEEAGDRGLQVIVKLANIHLTPEKPTYDAGTWHVEGQLNEHICATALFYYDCENITESRLAFRQDSELDVLNIEYEQGDHVWLEAVYGCEQHGPKAQEVLSVVCEEDRLLTFSNILQHQVKPFKLADPTKPGHRKILALFLVDPRMRVISTANIPPQQHHWWAGEVARMQSLDRLPPELQQKVMDEVDYPMHMDEAKKLRLELMEERSIFAREQNDIFTSHEFNLCEH